MTKIKDILALPVGQGTGGYELTIKTAKKAWEAGGHWYQRLMVTDGTDEMLAEVKLHGNVRLLRNVLIRIVVGKMMARDVNNVQTQCLIIHEWADASPVMSEPMNMMTDAEEWYAARQEEIRGKCRYGVVCAIRRKYGLQDGPLTDNEKRTINMDVEFVMTGK